MENTNSGLKKIPLGDLHQKNGAKMVPFAGFLMPVKYTSETEEHLAVRNKAGIFDVSHMGEFMVSGPQALELIQYITSNDASVLVDGKIQYSCFVNEQGGIVDDLLVYKLGDNKYMLVVNAGNIDKDFSYIKSKNTFEATVEDISEQMSLFAVQGPKAINLLQKLTSINLSDIPYYNFVQGTLAGVSDIIISATGYTGAGGFEIYVNNVDALTIWNAIQDAGKEYELLSCGLGARDTLRLEKGYCLYGNDINDETTPLEAGLGWITKFKKKFVGDEILKSQKEAGIEKKLVGFELIERGIPRAGYEIVDAQENVIGKVTSGTQSPILNSGVGLGYVAIAEAKNDNEIFIKIRNKNIKAIIKPLPFL